MIEAGKAPASLDRPRVRVTTALRRLDAEARDRPQSLSAGRTCLGASAIRPSGPSHRPSEDVTFASKADSLARTRRHNLRPSMGRIRHELSRPRPQSARLPAGVAGRATCHTFGRATRYHATGDECFARASAHVVRRSAPRTQSAGSYAHPKSRAAA